MLTGSVNFGEGRRLHTHAFDGVGKFVCGRFFVNDDVVAILKFSDMGAEEKPSGNEGEDQAIANGGRKLANGNVGTSEALGRLKESEASEWLAAPPSLVLCAKQASEILFSLTANNFEKAPLSKLYTDRFDAEQIWQQIDLQAHPVLSYIRRRVRNLEKSGNDAFFTGLEANEKIEVTKNGKTEEKAALERQRDADHEIESEDVSDDDEMEDAEAGLDSDDEDVEKEEEEEEDEDEEGEKTRGKNGVEDDFLRISEMEKFLDRTDAGGIFGTGGEDVAASPSRLDDEEGDDDDDDEEDEDAEDFEAGASDDDEGEKDLGFGKYEEFFGKSKKKNKLKSKQSEEEGNSADGSGDELSEDDGRDAEDTNSAQLQSKSLQVEKLSAHERRQERIETRIKKLEKASLDPKDWTQQGEVTAKKRPKNSALEVELDFEHNVRPPPVITEEVTASLEDMIRARIAEAQFDDVQRKAAAPVAPVRERVELDESKSRQGLGEIYEAEYMQTAGFVAAPTPTSEVLKDEARELFKALCGRLDALSHFHFAPKPVIEDMGIRADIPSLAMEEVAPLAVSEASMLAPEEIFTADDAIKGEGELTADERKRWRAKKKRKRKGERKAQEAERVRKRIRPIGSAPVELMPTPGLKIAHSSYSKSSKVFAEIDRTKGGKGKAPPKKNDRQTEKPLHASFLKL